ncbi:MAG: hypothetical protein ACU88J_03540, partial [Gammaproteobacteria bacterium]
VVTGRFWPLPVTRQFQKANLKYRSFRVVIFLTGSLSPPGPLQLSGCKRTFIERQSRVIQY